jgi:hypothetical protein
MMYFSDWKHRKIAGGNAKQAVASCYELAVISLSVLPFTALRSNPEFGTT